MQENPKSRLPDPPRLLGYWPAHFLVMASMIGAGILTTSGFTLQATGNPAALLGLWILGGLAALAGAVTVAEMATSLPRAGGDYVFVKEAFGQGAGVVAGWATFVVGFCGPTAVVAHIAVSYLISPFSSSLSQTLQPWIVPSAATLLIIVITLTHCLGQKESGRFQIAITTIKVILLSGLGLGGLLLGNSDWSHWNQGHWPQTGEWSALATGLIYVSYSYSGWNGAAYLAGEIRDPVRLLPRAMILGTLSVVALYLLVNIAYVNALDPTGLTMLPPAQVERVAELAVNSLFGRPAANLFAVLIGLSLIGSASAYILAGPRVTFAMARDGYFPKFAGKLHPNRHIPIWATLVQGTVAIAFLWSGSFLQLLDYVSVGLAAVSGLVVASVFPLRAKIPTQAFRMPLYPIPPLIYLSLIGWTILAQLLDNEKRIPALLSLASILIGIPVAGLLKNRKNMDSI